MSAIGSICDKFNTFYKEIDCQILQSQSLLQNFCESLEESENELPGNPSCMTTKDIDNLITIAKEFESELQQYVEDNKLKSKPMVQKKAKVVTSFPPIWNDENLKDYIAGVLDELLEDTSVEEEDKQNDEPQPANIIVKPDTPISSQVFKPKKTAKRIETKSIAPKARSISARTNSIDPKKISSNYEFENPNNTLFPRRVAKAAPNIPIVPETAKTPEILSKSQRRPKPKSPKLMKNVVCSPQPLKAEVPKISPTTITSTISFQKPQCSPKVIQPAFWREANVEQTNSSIATSAKCIKPTKHATKYSVHHQAALSIKGECTIEKVLHFEISPSPPIKAINSKYAEFIYNDATSDSHANKSLSVGEEIEGIVEFNGANNGSTEIDRNCNRRLCNDDNEARQVERNVIIDDEEVKSFDCRDLQRLSNQQLHISDEKVNISIQSTISSKSKARKLLIEQNKPLLRKSKKNEKTSKSTQPIEDVADLSSLSEVSSSITDDIKLRNLLLNDLDLPGDWPNTMASCVRKINEASYKTSDSSNFPPTESSTSSESLIEEGKTHKLSIPFKSPEKINEVVVPAKIPQSSTKDVQVLNQHLLNDFSSIYQMIEETFHSSASTSVPIAAPDNTNEDIKTVIKLSEENIRKANQILLECRKQNEQIIAESSEKARQNIVSLDGTAGTAIKLHKCAISSYQLVEIEGDKESTEPAACKLDQIVQTDDAYDTFAEGLKLILPAAVPEPKLREDKLVQTERKSQQIFGDVYDKYSDFKHLQFHPPKTLPRQQHNVFCSSQPSCNCIGCSLRQRLISPNPAARKSLFSTQQFQQNVMDIAPRYSSTLKDLLSSPKKVPVPYNTIYSEDDEIMEAANKFLRSVEKRKQTDDGSDLSSWESNRYARIAKSSESTPSKEKEAERFLVWSESSSSVDKSEQKCDDELGLISSSSLEDFSIDSNKNTNPTKSATLKPYMSEGEILSQGELEYGDLDDLNDF